MIIAIGQIETEVSHELETISEEQNEQSDDEGFRVLPLYDYVPASRNSKAIFFNIASLFLNSDITVIPEQFLDNAKNSLEKWSAKEDNKLMKAFQRYENNWQKI